MGKPPPGGTRKGDAVRHRHRAVVALAATIGTTAALLGPVAPASAGPTSAHQLFPTVISLPDGFQPEGIAIGVLPFAFFGSRAGGSIYRVNLITGTGSTINPGFGEGTASLGMKVDSRARLFVAGAGSGDGRVVDAITGDTITTYDFTASADTFVNDVVLTPTAAWFTDSRQKVLYGLPLGRKGRLPSDFVTLPMTGDIDATWVAGAINANGISRTPDGRALLIVQSNTGLLFRVDPRTGHTTRVDLGGATLANGDGLLLAGRVLFVVQNRLNQIAVVLLSRSLDQGRVVAELTDPDFDVPTTIAFQAGHLYAVNARFGTTDPQPARYDIVRVG
jgi:sugar lactone lactonase YvrE